MKTALIKDGLKEIKISYKRFLSILLIVLLGVGFFAGLRATSPDMKKTLDTYFDDLNVMDAQVISTLGLTDDDITSIKNLENVEQVEGSYQTDATVTIGDEEVVVKLETFSDNINKLNLTNGRMPEKENECVVEENFLEGTGHKIGDSITIDVADITNDDGEEQKVLKNNKVTIVGTVKSPLYISTDRGSTELGSGIINYYLYVPKENINVDIYTNIYLTVSGAKELNTTSNDYEELINTVTDNLEGISEERREARYNQLYDAANSKIEDAQKEFDEEKEKGQKEIDKAEKEIEDAKKELEDGKNELATNRANANSKFASAEQELENGKTELEKQEKEFEQTKIDVNNQIEEYEKNLSTLRETKTQLDTLESNLDKAQQSLEQLEAALENGANMTEEEKAELQNQIAELNVQIQTIQAGIGQIENGLKAQGITDIDTTISTLQKGISTAKTELANGEEQIQSAKKQLESSEKELENQKNSTYYQLNQAEKELEKAEEEIEDGEKELVDAQKEFDKEIEKAEKELLDAKEELKKIERPEWYILDRDQNMGYASYVQDTDRVDSLAQVFPVVFFLVAALVSLTSMARMVEEERVQIGTFKALGYSKLQISRKFIIYAVVATVVGGMIGIFIGFNLIPKIVADMYAMVYDVPEVILEYNFEVSTFGIAAAFICTVGATIYTCARELRHNPATLMRPKSPKPGKRVILEKIPFVWKHLNFTAKVTARNLFRYKKRFMMTIIGVFGCTSMIIAGFALRDSIARMIPKQYGEIDKYNISISLGEEYSKEELEKIQNKILEHKQITDILSANLQSVKIIKNDNNQSIQLIIPNDISKLDTFITLRNRTKLDEKYTLDDSGVIMTEKLANLLDIKEGDTIELENADGDRRDVKVSKITENYLMHYIYMTPELYNTTFDDKIEPNTVYAITTEMSEEQEEALGRELLANNDEVSGVSFTSSTEDMFATVMANMDTVVWILIIAAGLLALVVLYNLLNANISERIRELATIKVLGFYDREVYSYIARETIILTIIGILLGLLGGNVLTTYILKTCELDITMFDPEIGIWSYVLGVVITIFFAIIVNIVTYFSLKKIDMIESLKSVE